MVVMVLTLIVYIISFLLAFCAFKFYRSYKYLNANGNHRAQPPPCLPSLPIIGSLLVFPNKNINSMPSFFMEKSRSLGNVIAFYMCNRYVVVLNKKKTIQEALVKHSLSFSSRPTYYLSNIFNKKRTGIVEHPYNDHFKLHHRICLNILKHFGFGQGVMEARIKAEVEDLLRRVDDKKDEAFDPSFEITAAVSNVISSIIFGRSWSKDDPNFHEGLDIIHSFLSDDTNSIMIDFFPVVRYLPYYNQCLKNYKNLRKRWDSYIENVISDALKSDVENFCNLYLKEANSSKIDIMKEDQLKNTIRDLFLAGTETTATTLLWFIIIMANNQDVQKRVQNELDRVVGSNRLPCLEDKPNLPITEAFILEAMRFKTLVPMALLHLTTKETIIDGVLIPSGVMVMPNIYSAHMNSEDWVDPEIFKIERFLNDDQTQVVNRNLIIPFSLGKRACLGEILAKQEIFLFTTSILHRYSILPKKCYEKIVVEEIIGITVSPSPFEARLVKRN